MTESKPEYFYKYVTAETAIAILYNGSVRFSSPRLFNDPFDTQYEHLAPYTKKHYSKVVETQIRKFVFEQRSKSLKIANSTKSVKEGISVNEGILFLLQEDPNRGPDEIVKMMKPFIYEFLEPGAPTVIREINKLSVVFKNTRIFCVTKVPASKTPDSLLMWAHYADSHNGAVIKFKCLPESDTNLHMARRVNYTEDIPQYNLLNKLVAHLLSISKLDSVSQNLNNILTTTKSKEWIYEKEWRVVERFESDAERNLGYKSVPILPAEIDEIVLGCKMSKDNRDKITALIAEKYSHASVIWARKHPRKYGLSFRTVRKGTDKATT